MVWRNYTTVTLSIKHYTNVLLTYTSMFYLGYAWTLSHLRGGGNSESLATLNEYFKQHIVTTSLVVHYNWRPLLRQLTVKGAICMLFRFREFGLKTPVHAPNNRVLGGWSYKYGTVSTNLKGHIIARVRVVWAILRENPTTRLTCRWVAIKGV